MWHIDMMPRPVSSDHLDPTRLVFSPPAGGLLSRGQPVGGVLRVRGACPTLGTAAQCCTEPRADWLGAKNKHDAVGCSLCRVADTLGGEMGEKEKAITWGLGMRSGTTFPLVSRINSPSFIIEVPLLRVNPSNCTTLIKNVFYFLSFSRLRVKWPALGSVWPESRREAGWSALCSKCAGRWRWWEWAWAWRQPWRSCETETCWAGWGDTQRAQRAAAERKEEAVKSIEQYWSQ